MKIDLRSQLATGPDGTTYPFDIDAFRKKCLLEGLDDVGITLQHEAAIAAFETRYRKRHDWLFDGNL
jgi:3-isopropylmalate/(R)-2-methylmalate dehydratase small subunit